MFEETKTRPAREAWSVTVPPGYRVGSWVIEAPIATGSWGSVYAATPAVGSLRSEVAVKFLPVDRFTPQQAAHLRELAEREVACLQRLRHRPSSRPSTPRSSTIRPSPSSTGRWCS